MSISIVICTYNRPELLLMNLVAIRKALLYSNYLKVEIVVVNNGHLNVLNFITEFEALSKMADVIYFEEKNIGLSYSRNRGYLLANKEFVCYIDDDMFVDESFFHVLHSKKGEIDFDCFGGRILPKYLSEPPNWLPSNYGDYSLGHERISKVSDGFIMGGMMIIKKNILVQLEGFNIKLGMTGKKIGYSEEREFQDRMKKNGYKLGYLPELIGYHIVGEHKFHLPWHFKSEYIMKRDDMLGSPLPLFRAFAKLLLIVATLPVHCVRNVLRLQRADYYIESAILQTLLPLYRACGRIHGIIKYHYR